MKLIIELILIGYLTNFILCQPPPYANYTDLLFNMITNYLEGMSDSGNINALTVGNIKIIQI